MLDKLKKVVNNKIERIKDSLLQDMEQYQHARVDVDLEEIVNQ